MEEQLAAGFLEVMGYGAALVAMDHACKTADVRIVGIDSINPKNTDVPIPVTVQVKFVGRVSDVQAAVRAAREAAGRFMPGEDVIAHVIESPYAEIEKLLGISKVKIS